MRLALVGLTALALSAGAALAQDPERMDQVARAALEAEEFSGSVLVARDGQDVAELLAGLTPERAAEIGEAARMRVLAEHSYTLRGAQVDALLRAQLRQVREAA